MTCKKWLIPTERAAIGVHFHHPLGAMRAVVLMSECLPHRQQQRAMRQLAAQLAAQGFGVVRLKWQSASLKDAIADLTAVSWYVSQQYPLAQIVLGHSLGGLAALGATGDAIKAVVTINTPFDFNHAQHHLSQADGKLAPLPAHLQAECETLLPIKNPLPALHFCGSEDVLLQGQDGGSNWLRLPACGHLLLKPDLIRYVGESIGSFARLYLAPISHEEHPPVTVSLAGNNAAAYSTQLAVGHHYWFADEPQSLGGNDLGATPTEQVLAALGACTAITLKMYARRKKWDFARIGVRLEHRKIDTDAGKVSQITRQLVIDSCLDERARQRLLEIANRCPVHRLLTEVVGINTTLNPSTQEDKICTKP